MKYTGRAAIFVVAAIITTLIVYGFVAMTRPWDDLPDDPTIAYKEVQRRGILRTKWYVLVTDSGQYYRVTEDIWNTVEILQKIDDGLYRMPDGTLLPCSPCEEARSGLGVWR